MRRVLASSLIALSFSLASPVLATNYQKFESTVSAPLQQSVRVEVVLSEDLAYRADHLPKKLRDRSGSRGLNDGFAGNGYYGKRDLERLTERFQAKLTKRFAKQGLQVDPNANTVLRITLVDAKPNRPTFEQLSRNTSLSFQSFGIGGAEMTGELLSVGGQSLGTMSYAWYEDDIRDARFGATWSDAYRAFDRFSRQAANNLTR